MRDISEKRAVELRWPEVGGIGIVLAEKLIARHLHLTWEHHLITADSLWLVGVADIPC